MNSLSKGTEPAASPACVMVENSQRSGRNEPVELSEIFLPSLRRPVNGLMQLSGGCAVVLHRIRCAVPCQGDQGIGDLLIAQSACGNIVLDSCTARLFGTADSLVKHRDGNNVLRSRLCHGRKNHEHKQASSATTVAHS